MSYKVPYVDFSASIDLLKEGLREAFERVLREHNYILGSEVQAFEASFAAVVNAKHCIGLNNGTSAVHLALRLLDLDPGDEVITTPFTFAATAWGISYERARPVFVDIDPSTYNIDSCLIEAAITPKTRAVVVVHLYGHPCDMDPIVKICNKHGLVLIEDTAQAHGALYKNQIVGSFGAMAAYSFFPTKNLGACGEAGALTTNEDRYAQRARSLRSHGSTQRYIYDEVGYNYRMEGLQGAFLSVKLRYLKDWNTARQKAAADYHGLLEEVAEVQLPHEAPWAESVYHLYTIRCAEREALAEHLQAQRIGYSMHYAKPLHLQPCYQNLRYKAGSLPVSEQAGREVINLPLFPGITLKQVQYVVNAIRSFYGYQLISESAVDTACGTLHS